MKIKLSVVICALNEENNIGHIIKSLNSEEIDEIILIDGGSIDNTISVAKSIKPSIIVLELPGQGKLRQLLLGIKSTNNDYLLQVDADDQLLENSVEKNIELLIRDNLDGVQFSYEVDKTTKWSTLWSKYLMTLANPGSFLALLGRPCIFNKNLFNEINFEDAPLGILSDDTWIHNAIGPKKFMVGQGRTLRKQPVTFREIFIKLANYGKEDARFVIDEKFSLIDKTYHLAIRYIFFYSFKGLRLHGLVVSLFIIFVGLTRLLSMYYHIIKKTITTTLSP